MKIYANDTATTTPFDPYVGKNVWVRCLRSYVNKNESEYIRFLGRHDWGNGHIVFDVSYIDVERLERYRNERYMYGPRNEFSLVETKQVAAIYLELVEPVQILTTEELFNLDEDALGEDSRMLDKLAKNELWFMATLLTGDDAGNDMYVKITEKTGDIMSIDFIHPCYVDDYSYDNGDWQPPSYYMDSCTINVDSIKVIEPLEVLTTTEFQEKLDESDDIFETGYNAEQEEEDEEE